MQKSADTQNVDLGIYNCKVTVFLFRICLILMLYSGIILTKFEVGQCVHFYCCYISIILWPWRVTLWPWTIVVVYQLSCMLLVVCAALCLQLEQTADSHVECSQSAEDDHGGTSHWESSSACPDVEDSQRASGFHSPANATRSTHRWNRQEVQSFHWAGQMFSDLVVHTTVQLLTYSSYIK